jgi:hypothetical protein
MWQAYNLVVVYINIAVFTMILFDRLPILRPDPQRFRMQNQIMVTMVVPYNKCDWSMSERVRE